MTTFPSQGVVRLLVPESRPLDRVQLAAVIEAARVRSQAELVRWGGWAIALAFAIPFTLFLVIPVVFSIAYFGAVAPTVIGVSVIAVPLAFVALQSLLYAAILRQSVVAIIKSGSYQA
jgi:hypothetical protein